MSTPPSELLPQPVPGGVTVAPATQTNTLAVVSLVTGIGSFVAHIIPFVGGFTLSVVAIITGHVARGQIKKTGEQGAGMALAGLIIGYVHLAILALVFIFFFGFVVAVLGAIIASSTQG
ncbi:MAG TPA: DUF4190 domain-containing protein [Candidatus Dormibacteraeota bacterium]